MFDKQNADTNLVVLLCTHKTHKHREKTKKVEIGGDFNVSDYINQATKDNDDESDGLGDLFG